MMTVRRSMHARIALVLALSAAAGPALAQYCPVSSTYFATNYVGSCTVGSCWSANAFAGSAPITGAYPAENYACATTAPAASALENTLYGYDANGNVTTVKDPLARTTTQSYDALNRLTQVLDPAGGLTRHAYNGNGSLTQVTDSGNLATGYAVNGFGETTSQSSPDTGTTGTTYDAAGNVLTRTDARGVTATYSYDTINRVTQVVYSKTGSPNEIHGFEYDGGAAGAPYAKGRLTRVTDPAAITSFGYEAHGRVASRTQTVSAVTHIVTYGYNAAGQLQTLTTPSGQQIGYTYLNNRVSGITVNGSALITAAIAEPFGAISSWHWGNGLYSFRDFDADGRIVAWEFRNGVSVLRNNLTHDVVNRITQVTDPANAALGSVYQYDSLDRLTVAQKGIPVTSTLQYTYDAVGNRLSSQVDAAVVTSDYLPSSNRLQLIGGAVDANYMLGAPSLAFTYNNANRLVAIQTGASSVATYLVNALGQRVQKTAGATTTRFVHDEAGHLLGEYDGAGNLIQETVWLEDMPVATLRPTGTGTPTPVALYYVHPDHLGTPRAVTRPADNVFMWRWDNTEPFGTNAANENPAGQGAFKYALRFPGQYYDAEIGTHYNYYRDYDPTIGRYLSSDPLGVDISPNTYAYVGSHPIFGVDPLGLAELCRKLILDDWRQIARDWKTIGYESVNSANHAFEALAEVLKELRHGHGGFFAFFAVPLQRDIILERMYELRVEVCVDECSQRETSRRTLSASPTRNYRENLVMSSGIRRGDPELRFLETDVTMNDRWRKYLGR